MADLIFQGLWPSMRVLVRIWIRITGVTRLWTPIVACGPSTES